MSLEALRFLKLRISQLLYIVAMNTYPFEELNIDVGVVFLRVNNLSGSV